MDFLHCNICGNYPFNNTQRRYCLTSCSHVLCENCTRKFGECCPVCASKCRLVEINGQAAYDVKMYFMDGAEILKDSLKRTIQVIQFQKQHVKSLGTHYLKTLTAYEALREQYNASKQEIEFLKAENDKLKQKLESLEQHEQNRIGCGSIQNPLELGIELFGNNKDIFPSFLNKRNDSMSLHTSTAADNCQQGQQRQNVRNFGAVGSGRPVSSTRPSPIGQSANSLYSSTSSINTGNNFSQHRQRDRLTLHHTPQPRSTNSPSPVHLTMGKCEFLSPAFAVLRTPAGSGSRFNYNYNPGSSGSGSSSNNDIVDRLKKLNCQKMI